ncbi:metallophosphoesterase [Nocardioides marmorisolisilvae]|uniref:Metallophosphoesterase n=2 Tax=Nocardioides marmorisolisilvae TaxID=1542737 RepID=A0A3N0DQ84_9ACTN|nr:metallophosphoesterase [Nocardioides marmorisolisilvae]
MVVAGHDAVVQPTFDHHVRLVTGPYLPDFRMPSDSQVGVRITIGKTEARSTDELIQRYALIASHTDVEARAVTREVKRLAIDAAVRAAVLALVPVLVWELLGSRRRTELRRPTRTGLVITLAFVVLAGFSAWQPWRPALPRVDAGDWVSLPDALPGVTVPPDLRKVEVQNEVFTQSTKGLVADLFGYYDRSKAFYKALVAKVPDAARALHPPAPGQTVALLISDRHDNIDMDQVVRAFADQAKATAVIDAGDDTSAGQSWESFSLESLDDSLKGIGNRIAISGNHDHGSFVSGYLAKHGWTHLDHRATEKFGVRFFGVDDPRASGLGAFIPVKGPTFAEETATLADEVCALDAKGERVATVVVHDATMARTALERGCTDLVVAGHVHVQLGPDRVVGENGKAGYTYTNGTTGGAAFAVAAVGKLRREAEFTFVTYQDGRPVGIQPVRVSTHGQFTVDPYIVLNLDEPH